MVVVVRVRPLLTEHGDTTYEPNASQPVRFGKDRNGSWGIKVTDPKSRSKVPRKVRGFSRVFGEEASNSCIADNILPELTNAALKGSTGTLFAYGHTGSGKTYTMFNVDLKNTPDMDSSQILSSIRASRKHMDDSAVDSSNNDPAFSSDFNPVGNRNVGGGEGEQGLWYFAAATLLQSIPENCLLKVSMFEVYNDEAYDLLDSGRKCDIREGEDKNTYIRSPPIVDSATGAVRMESGKHQCASTIEEVAQIVSAALKQRAVGSSTVHKSSSRSHALLELEIVNQEVLQARDNLIQKQAELTPIGKEKETEYLRHASKAFRNNPETGKFEMVPGVAPSTELLDQLTIEFDKAQSIVNEAKLALDKVMAESDRCVGGIMLFADLAGAEFAGKLTPGVSQTKAEEKQGREINKSLMALGACIRAIHAGNSHIPFRNSKLTRILRRFLIDKDAASTVIATVSPAPNHVLATISTLSQAQIMAKAEQKM